MIPVYIGISKQFDCIKGMTAKSILKNTDADVEIIHLYPGVPEGCTGFTNVRYTINHGIYLDCDMIVYGDVAELWSYRQAGKFVCMADGSTEVAVIDCEHSCKNKPQEYLLPKATTIPMLWNCEDECKDGMKLLHFTDLRTQPWFYDHPDPQVTLEYERHHNSAGTR